VECRPCLKVVAKAVDTGSIDRRLGSGRRCSACTADNIDLDYELVSKREIIFILYLIILTYCLHKIIKIGL